MALTVTVEAVYDLHHYGIDHWVWTATGGHGWTRSKERFPYHALAMWAGILAKRDEFGCTLTADEAATVARMSEGPPWR
jgi:hypothetical protein